jgi:hypothetical protein
LSQHLSMSCSEAAYHYFYLTVRIEYLCLN